MKVEDRLDEKKKEISRRETREQWLLSMIKIQFTYVLKCHNEIHYYA